MGSAKFSLSSIKVMCPSDSVQCSSTFPSNTEKKTVFSASDRQLSPPTQMAGLCWMAVVLTFCLSTGDSLAAVDQTWLTSVIEGIKNEYALGDTFSLAVNVPQNQDINDLQQVFQDDPADMVKQTVSKSQVYQGTRVVAAEAVSQVLENIQPLIANSLGNFLIIYSEESPCGPTCTLNTNVDSITAKINDVIQNWSNYAFVFSKVVNVPAADTSQLAESFKQLGISKFGLDNIFRCYKPGDDPFQCTSCSSGGDVTPSCVANDAQSNQNEGAGEEVSTVPPAGIETEKETAPGEEISAGLGTEIITGIGGGTGGGGGKEKGRPVSKCKGRGSRKGGCKRKGGGKRGKGGKVKKQTKRKGGSKRGKGGKVKKQTKRKGGSKRGKGGKVKKQTKRKGSSKRGKGGKIRKVRKQKRGGKGRGWGKPRGGRRGRSKRRRGMQ